MGDINLFKIRATNELWANAEGQSFYVAFFLFVLLAWLNNTVILESLPPVFISLFEGVIQLAVLLLLACSFLSQRATKQEWVVATLLAILSVVVWRTARQGWMLWLTLFVLCGKDIDLKRVATILFYEMLAIVCLVVLLSFCGSVEDVVFVRDDGSTRHSMGFIHPNLFGSSLLIVCVSYAVKNFPKKKPSTCMMFAVCALAATFIADSRTASVCMIAGAMLYLALGVAGKFGGVRFLIAFLGFAILILLGLSVYLTVFYDSSLPLHSFIDRLLSGRPYFMHLYYLDHAPGLFGYSYIDGTEHIVNGEAFTFIVDNMFSNVLLRYGLLTFGALFSSIFLLFWKSYKAKCLSPVLFGMAVFLIFGFAESLAARVECNFLLLGLSSVVYSKSSRTFDCDMAGQYSETRISYREFICGLIDGGEDNE